ncbi:folliculin-interacting protein middle domain-containing protein [Choanephora cucurbitarum]|nr:folliculin-interacting protein middle domain-containing protein [Choanephora cucurbitarum]
MDIGSFKDTRHDWKPSYLKTMPSLCISDQQKQYARHSHRKLDLTGEMIFGTAPLAYKGMNTKIHYYKRDKSPQIIVSKLFTLNSVYQHHHAQQHLDSPRRRSFSSINSDRSSFMANSSLCEDNVSEQSSDDDHFSISSSIYPPVVGLCQSTKRTRRFSQTNMENGSFSPTPLPTPRLSSHDNPVRLTSRSVKFAVAIVITLEEKNVTLYDFIFSHFALIENRLHQLQAVAFRQLYQHFKSHPPPQQLQPRKRSSGIFLSSNAFQNDSVLIDAANHFKQAFYDLYTTPRIQEPLWLNRTTFPHKKSEYDMSLMKELMFLVHQFNNKAHNHFISTLLTGVLMHHLSWVHTVAPPEAENNAGCHHGNYDPLWAQLSDLYGFIGTPSRVTRTLVVGLRPSIVRRILYILSYFIRCNEVFENTETRTKQTNQSIPTSASTESIFSREVLDDAYSEHRFEDRIVKHLTGGIESIAIPPGHSHHSIYPSSSMDSSSLKSSSKWLSDTDERSWSPDPCTILSSSPSSIGGEMPSSIVPTECYYVPMPKSTITHMEPDITAIPISEQETDVKSIIPSHCLFSKSYGRSLMASYSDTYKSDFVLLGVPTLPPLSVLDADLKSTLEQFTLSDSVYESSCLVIDANNL